MAKEPKKPSTGRQGPSKKTGKPHAKSASGGDTAQQQSMKSRAQQAAQDEDAEDDQEYEAEESHFSVWMKQSPSWLISMLVHMILLIVLALISLGIVIDDSPEITIGENITEEPLEEEDEALNEELEEDESESEEEVEEITSPVDLKVEAPEMTIANENDDTELEAAKIEFSEFATTSAVSGDLLSDLGGTSASGLGGRTTGGRAAGVRKGGGNKGSESAVEAALKWLANHQNRDGSWSWNHTPGDKCSGFANPGEKATKMGATGLALLPFLGAGYTHQDGKNNKYKYVVEAGLKYLVGNMDPKSGRLYDRNGATHEHMYSHGIAACAVAEAYGMTQDPKLKAPAQLALNYIVAAQDPESGGWLYTPREGGDTSVVGWQIMALKSGILSYLTVPGYVKTRANKWLDFVQSDPYSEGTGIGSRYGYRLAQDRHGHQYPGAVTAIGLLCRNYLGTKKGDPGLRMGVEWLASQGPTPSDMYYNYYASMVMYQNDGPKGDLWKGWNRVMRDRLINTQKKAGNDRGSWHFSGNHGDTGGRLYNTALAAMTLEVYYRYMPVYQQSNVDKDDFPLE